MNYAQRNQSKNDRNRQFDARAERAQRHQRQERTMSAMEQAREDEYEATQRDNERSFDMFDDR